MIGMAACRVPIGDRCTRAAEEAERQVGMLGIGIVCTDRAMNPQVGGIN
jgi:hypothetical protein